MLVPIRKCITHQPMVSRRKPGPRWGLISLRWLGVHCASQHHLPRCCASCVGTHPGVCCDMFASTTETFVGVKRPVCAVVNLSIPVLMMWANPLLPLLLKLAAQNDQLVVRSRLMRERLTTLTTCLCLLPEFCVFAISAWCPRMVMVDKCPTSSFCRMST